MLLAKIFYMSVLQTAEFSNRSLLLHALYSTHNQLMTDALI